MARASWQGYITLGNLGIPVRLYSATQATQPRFILLHERDGSPIERPYVCRHEGIEIAHSETIRAVETEPGRYITLSDRELEQAAVGPVKSIAIQQFAAPNVVSPIHYDKPFYVVPAKGGERAYALMREVLARTNRVGVTEFMLHNKQHVCLLALYGDLLMLHQLRFVSEIVPRSSVKTPRLPKPSPSEIEALSAVVERFGGPFYLEDYHDEHAEHVAELIDRKARGLKPARSERLAPQATPEADIIPTLRHALEEQELLPTG